MTTEQAPRAIGRYEIVRSLGKGAVGQVYLARDPRLDRLVAIKVLTVLEGLPPEEQAEARARFEREARAAAALSHPSVVTIHDIGEHNGIPYIAMEYLKGVTLDRHTREGHLLPAHQVIDIGKQAALALAEAHSTGIVHRDIKPANLVLLEDGALKVADFGLAKDPRTALTSDQSLVGTPNYMSPEQIAGRPLDGRTDLFALAVALFEMLTGSRPFSGESVSSVLYRIVNDPPRRLAELRPDLPADADSFFSKALAKDPAERYSDGVSFADALAALPIEPLVGEQTPTPARLRTQRGSGSSSPSGNVSSTQASHRQARRFPLAATVLLLTLLLIPLLWTAPLWAGFDPLGGSRRNLEDSLSRNLGKFGDWVRVTRPVQLIAIETNPAKLAVRVAGGAVELDSEGRLHLPGDLAQPFMLEIDDRCWEGGLSAGPNVEGKRLTIQARPKQLSVPVSSDPPGAMLTIDADGASAKTPTTVLLDSCKAHKLRFEAPGRSPQSIELAADETPEFWKGRLNSVSLSEEVKPTGTIVLPRPRGYQYTVETDGGKRLGRGGESVNLPIGEYRIKLSAPEVLLHRQQLIRVAAGSRTLLQNLPSVGHLTVRSAIPAKLSIQTEGMERPQEIDETPVIELPIVEGPCTLLLELSESGNRLTRSVTISGQGTQEVNLTRADWH